MAEEQAQTTEGAAEQPAKKKRTSAKRPAAKKAAKKTSAKRASRARYSDDAKIKVIKKDNPYRDKTIGHKLYEAMLKSKTIGDYRAAGKKIYRGAMAYLVDAMNKKAISLA
jgi:hypothetical protein